MLTTEKLQKIYPGADNEFVSIINMYAKQFGITNKKRMAMFLAQTLHESRGFNVLQESFNYRPARLLKVFRSRIKTLEKAKALVNKGQEALANFLYGGRYGNKKNEGWKYSGKGLGGLTFKANYEKVQDILYHMGVKVDIVNNPEILLKKDISVLTFMAFWQYNKLNSLSDKKKIVTVSKKVNGGTNGLEERIHLYNKALKIL